MWRHLQFSPRLSELPAFQGVRCASTTTLGSQFLRNINYSFLGFRFDYHALHHSPSAVLGGQQSQRQRRSLDIQSSRQYIVTGIIKREAILFDDKLGGYESTEERRKSERYEGDPFIVQRYPWQQIAIQFYA
jgi:hypothetical protein